MKRRMRSSDRAGKRVFRRATEGFIGKPTPQYAVRVSNVIRYATKETGFLDTQLDALPFNTTGQVSLLNVVPQGNTQTTRVGKKILLKGVQIRGSITYATTNVPFHHCAYVLIYDKRPDGAVPGIADILAAASSNALNNDTNSGRFMMLKREDFMINHVTSSSGEGQLDTSSKVIDDYVPLKGMETVYKALGTGAIADIEQGALYLMVIGDQPATGDFPVGPDWNIRVRFHDV